MTNLSLPALTEQVIYLAIVFILLVIPRTLQKYRIPAPLTCFALGMITVFGIADYSHDTTLSFLAALGISSLFLFAGLEVDMHDLKKGFWPLLSHLFIRCLIVFGFTWVGMNYLNYSMQVSGLIALALLTPSTGFILESLSALDLDENEIFWVKSKAIAGELLALLLLFVFLKSGSAADLATSSGVLLAIGFGLPLLFMFSWAHCYSVCARVRILITDYGWFNCCLFNKTNRRLLSCWCFLHRFSSKAIA